MLRDEISAKFINSVIKSIQAVCHGYVEFNSNIQVLGHIYLSVDSQTKFDYILNEVVCKNSEESSTMFVSNSFHAEPPQKRAKEKGPLSVASNSFPPGRAPRTDAGGGELFGLDANLRYSDDHSGGASANASLDASVRRKPQRKVIRKRRLSDSLLSCQYSQSREADVPLIPTLDSANERTADLLPSPEGMDVDQKPLVQRDSSAELEQPLDEAADVRGDVFPLQRRASEDQLTVSSVPNSDGAYHLPQHERRRQRFRSQSPMLNQSSGVSHQFVPVSSHSEGDGQQQYYAHSQGLTPDSDASLPLTMSGSMPLQTSYASTSTSAAVSLSSTVREADCPPGADRTSRTSEQDSKEGFHVDVDLTLVKDEDSGPAGLSSCVQSGPDFGSTGSGVPQSIAGWEVHQNQDDLFQGRGGSFPPMMRLDASGTAVCYEGGGLPSQDMGGLLDNPHLVPVMPHSHGDPSLLPGHGDPGQDVMAAVQKAEGFSLPRPPPLSRPRHRAGTSAGRHIPRAGRIPKELAEQYGMVELMPGSGVYLHPYQMPNEQRLQGKDGRVCGMRMARHLMSALYSPSELINATLSPSSARHQPLDQVVTDAITNYCMMKTHHRRGEIREAMRSKISCIQTRHRQKSLRHLLRKNLSTSSGMPV